MRRQTRLALNALFVAAIAAALIGIFVFVALVVLSPIRENIHFVEQELKGVRDHKSLMLIFQDVNLAQDKKMQIHAQLRNIGNESNLILDPEISSYYLMNIAVKLLPDMLLNGDVSLQEYFIGQIGYSLKQVQLVGLDAQPISEALATLKNDPKHIGTLYDVTTALLETELNARLAKETTRLWQQIIIMSVLFVLFSALATVAVRYYLKRKIYQAAEERLQLVEKLEKANAELEHFSYFTAHDLKEPVRTIACFAALMEESPTHTQHLPTIRKAALRMETLINDVLCYLSSGEKSSLERVDVNEVLKEVQEDLHAIIASTGATFSVELLPEIRTSRLTLSRVLQNIIANAMHYRNPDIAPHIHIDATKQGGDWVFTVSDNGMGFDMAYAEQVFEPFKRLHDASAKSSGIGLSICKKLLGDIGGDIWIESTPNVGTLVFFKLPAT
jgi:signal transduction histidine kinase